MKCNETSLSNLNKYKLKCKNYRPISCFLVTNQNYVCKTIAFLNTHRFFIYPYSIRKETIKNNDNSLY